MLRALAAASLLLLAPIAASAQEGRQYAYDEIAGDLAYGFCPLFLADQFPLTSPQLAERGFAATIHTQQNARFGELRMVSASHRDGDISFGGAPGKVCTVVASGPNRGAALTKLREAMSWTGLAFEPTPHVGPEIPGVTIETFKAPVEGQTLYVQLLQIGEPTPSVVAQLFATEE
jgi:hypothetical protein